MKKSNNIPNNKLEEIDANNKEINAKLDRVNYDKFWDNTAVVLLFSLTMALVDGMFLYPFLTKTFKTTGAVTSMILAIAIPILLNVIPTPAGKYYNEAKYGIRKGAVFAFMICFAAWVLLYGPIGGMRVANYLSGSTSSSIVLPTNSYGSAAASSVAAAVSNTTAAPTTLFNFTDIEFWKLALQVFEPAVTSLIVFILSLRSSDPVKKEAVFLKKEIARKRTEIGELEAARLCMDIDPDTNRNNLILADDSLYDLEVQAYHNEADALKIQARQMLAAYTKDPSAISRIVKDSQLILEPSES